MIGSMLIGWLIAFLAAAITNRGERMGCIGKILLGWAGAWIGQLLFGYWGPQVVGTAVVPSILGAMLLLAIFWRRDS
ncbi:GlsB/YeaQ/YmgE family stress response membrane protein [Streptococcus pneumoniae]